MESGSARNPLELGVSTETVGFSRNNICHLGANSTNILLEIEELINSYRLPMIAMPEKHSRRAFVRKVAAGGIAITAGAAATGTAAASEAPVADPDYPTGSIQTGDSVLFDGSDSYDPDGGNIVDHQWIFYEPGSSGDQPSDAGFEATYERSFQKTGTWDANLTVWDDEDESDVRWFTFEVVE